MNRSRRQEKSARTVSVARLPALVGRSFCGRRPFRFRGDLVGPGVEELHELIAELVREQKQLRASGASHTSLERNRRQLARSQLELSHALIERHVPRSAETSP